MNYESKYKINDTIYSLVDSGVLKIKIKEVIFSGWSKDYEHTDVIYKDDSGSTILERRALSKEELIELL